MAIDSDATTEQGSRGTPLTRGLITTLATGKRQGILFLMGYPSGGHPASDVRNTGPCLTSEITG